MYTTLFLQLTPNTTIITSSRRLANTLHAEYANRQQMQQKIVWQTPDILTMEDWLVRCWHDYTLHHMDTDLLLLTQAQEQTLWEQIIYDSSYGETLLRVSATAKLAREAWHLMKQSQADMQNTFFKQSDDSTIWHNWATEFKQRCSQNKWLDIASLPEQLSHAIKSSLFIPPKKIILTGFDEIHAQYRDLFKLVDESGCECIQLDQTEKYLTKNNLIFVNTETYRISLTDKQDELHTMACWAKQLWQQGAIHIGCIVPNLNELRQEVINVFTEVLAPEVLLAENHLSSLPFNIAGGMSLNQFPLVKTAFTILNLTEDFNLSVLNHLLLTVYINGSNTEIALRSNIDVALKELGEPEIHWRQVVVLCKKLNCLQFAKQLSSYFDNWKKYYHRHLFPSQWSNLFSELLAVIGWPGSDRQLDSNEYQTIARFTKLLEEFTTQDILLGPLSYQAAIQKLHHLAANTLFQTQTGFKPIQILDINETPGLEFRHLWIMGLDDNQWPPSISPNPFIPLQLQHQYGMPQASNAQQLAFYRQVTMRLLKSASCCVIISYSQYDEDKAIRPSALIKNLPIIDKAKLAIPNETSYILTVFQSAELEFIEDHQGPCLPPEEMIKGGTEIFKHQAACPFRAFTRFRLHAKPINQPQLGLSASQRGLLVHHSLETFYNLVQTQQMLLSLSAIELTKIVEQAIDKTCLQFGKKYPLTFKKNFSYIEKNRLKNLLERWLAFEKQRPAFTIASIEQQVKFVFDHLTLSLRVDRIDQLADGSLIIIDYKTGTISSNDWFGERLNEPQLPIYCISHEAPIKAIIFIQLRSHGYKIDGISAYETGIPGVKSIQYLKEDHLPKTWDDLLIYWRQHLFNLSQQFLQGHAIINPKDGKKTCNYCDFKTLCRYNELE